MIALVMDSFAKGLISGIVGTFLLLLLLLDGIYEKK
jgi:hypothetical protein